MADLIDKYKALEILNDLGGCDAQEEYYKGWDAAIDAAYNDIRNLPRLKSFTRDELCIISFGLGMLAASIELKDIDFSSIMEKINRMVGEMDG